MEDRTANLRRNPSSDASRTSAHISRISAKLSRRIGMPVYPAGSTGTHNVSGSALKSFISLQSRYLFNTALKFFKNAGYRKMSVRYKDLTVSFLDRGPGSRNESGLYSCAGRRFADEPTDRTPHRKIGGQTNGDHVHRKQFVFVLQDESRRFQAWLQHSLYAGLQSHDHRKKRNGSVAVLRPQRLS